MPKRVSLKSGNTSVYVFIIAIYVYITEKFFWWTIDVELIDVVENLM